MPQQHVIQRLEVQTGIGRVFLDAQSTADIHDPDVRKAVPLLAQKSQHPIPVFVVEDAAAAVGMQASHTDVMFAAQGRGDVEFIGADAELGGFARGAHVTVVTFPVARVQAQENVAIVQEFHPLAQRVEVVNSDGDALVKRPPVFILAGKIGREEDVQLFQITPHFLEPQQLAGGDGFKAHAVTVHGGKNISAGVGLDRVEDFIHCLQGFKGLDLLDDSGFVVHVHRTVGAADVQQQQAIFKPPGWFLVLCGQQFFGQLFPGGAEFTLAETGNQAFVHGLDQFVGLILVHHQRQVQVIGRLGGEVNAAFGQLRHQRGNFVQQGADAVAHQRDGGAVANHPHIAQLGQLLFQGFQGGRFDYVVSLVQRHGDVGLGGGNQVNRQAQLPENGKDICQVAGLMPHVDGVDGNQCDAMAGIDGAHLGLVFIGVVVQRGKGRLRVVAVVYLQRNVVFFHRQNTARVQHLAPGGGDFPGFLIIQLSEQPGGGNHARIGREDAVHIGPYFQFGSLQRHRQVGRRCVGTATPKQHRTPGFIAQEKSWHQYHAVIQTLLQGRVGLAAAVGRQGAGAFIAAIITLADKTAAWVQRDQRQLLAEKRQRGGVGQLFAQGQHFSAFVGSEAFLAQVRLQGLQQRFYLVEVCAQFIAQLPGTGADGIQVFPCGVLQKVIQQVGETAFGRMHHGHVVALLLTFLDQVGNGLPALAVGNTGATEFKHDPGFFLCHRASLILAVQACMISQSPRGINPKYTIYLRKL